MFWPKYNTQANYIVVFCNYIEDYKKQSDNNIEINQLISIYSQKPEEGSDLKLIAHYKIK